ncbi:undecaprenyl-diphosphatase [Sinobacterium caligoides]|uniref:undecaprenyl-diphosphate phosphatase n=1 Tax=Sinobacterium caligoides TaxID=933926 RepID=A0A3N2DJP6_9GAMM|nr:undecaprenyl-diphosphatase [Sinobacterium caligoides]ROR99997.1 undecaprenyl-diphosphatase [Sinobacterium caligoides]
MQSLNVMLFNFINQYAGESSFLDQLAIGLAECLPYVSITALLYLWFKGTAQQRLFSLYAAIASATGLVISFIISLFYFHPRPFMQDLGRTLVEHAPDSSFPSDHTTMMFSIAITLLFERTTRKLAYVLCLLAMACGLSRIYCGVHFPFDIAAGLITAIIASAIVLRCRKIISASYLYSINYLQR